ncbi:site-specific integrase [Halobacteriovorax vibrionivorans]|uniref:Site-specific integrase n=1 Tax=Halobacteriovorax vibrionivorans TaxID=2152716 RepID=A0ABY0IH52_9BACT|nr:MULTISPECIES: site-specific integrase [Halobacteriovorax]RZF21166.1 site-specific integrase [Halobacteriovorax vibrionivorans]TGD46073.1 site-specific integrase [Halobacteriovorax sp. Y22]
MAITSYEKDGKTYYRVYIQERSSKDCTVRVQRSKAGIESLAQARREEKKLTKRVFELVASIEAKGITWKELAHRWEMSARNGLAGKKYTRPVIIHHVNTLYIHTDTWLDKRIKDLGRADGRYVINNLISENYSLSRIKAIKGSINKIWTWGVEEGLITDVVKSPVHGLVIESEKNKYKPILTLEEVRKLLYEAEIRKHPWRHIWAVALLTGMRSGELYALTWEDVDFDNNIIRITKSYSSRIKGVKSTKNSEWRNAHISEDLKEVLLKIRKLDPNSENVLPRAAGWRCGNAGKVIRDFLHRIGIEKHITFHTLRACFATHVLASGAEPTQVMKMGGWSDFKTFQIYVRMAGVDVKGVTDDFRVTPKKGIKN